MLVLNIGKLIVSHLYFAYYTHSSILPCISVICEDQKPYAEMNHEELDAVLEKLSNVMTRAKANGKDNKFDQAEVLHKLVYAYRTCGPLTGTCPYVQCVAQTCSTDDFRCCTGDDGDKCRPRNGPACQSGEL